VVAAIGLRAIWRASELAAPDHERLVQQPALLEVAEQTGNRFVSGKATLLETLVEIAMVVPIVVADLDETHASLNETAGNQTLAAEVVGSSFPTP
jgi:hypothetical protein